MSKKGKDDQLRKWGSSVQSGYQLVPNVLFRAQSRLSLDATDVVVLLNLSLHWWGADRLPFPPPAVIANRMGVSRRTVERRLERLEREGFLKRVPAEGGEQRRCSATEVSLQTGAVCQRGNYNR